MPKRFDLERRNWFGNKWGRSVFLRY